MAAQRTFCYAIVLMSALCVLFYGSDIISFYKRGDAFYVRETSPYQINCTMAMAKLNAEKVNQDNPRLIDVIKRCYLELPSGSPYNLKNPNREDYSQGGQANYVDNLLSHVVSCFVFIYQGLSYKEVVWYKENCYNCKQI